MKKSIYTKKTQRKLWICRAIDWIILCGPTFYYIAKVIADKGVGNVQKIACIGGVAIFAILFLVNIIFQKHLKSPLSILLLCIFFAAQNIMPLIVMTAIGNVLDEFVLSPLISHYKAKTIANSAFDERMV